MHLFFFTHKSTENSQSSPTLKRLGVACGVLVGAFLVFIATVLSVSSQSIVPAIIVIAPFVVIAGVVSVTLSDMGMAYVEICENDVTVVDYYLGIEKVKRFSIDEIKKVEIILGYSMSVRGYRHGHGETYLVFKDGNGRYLFKILNYPAAYAFASERFDVKTL